MTLPVDAILPELSALLAQEPAAILMAEPGAGKSTRVPLAMAEASWCHGRVLMLEPRRLAARATAEFMARSLGERLGGRVGLRTRLDSCVGPNARVEVVTEGILSRMLLADPALEGYQLVIFDEFHERSLQADLGLALARQCQQLLRPDLRLLVMSATLEAAPLSALLDDAPVLDVPGRCYPVSVSYQPPPRRDQWLDHAAAVIRQGSGQSGTTLVFLPGQAEIRQLEHLLADLPSCGIQVQTLFGNMAASDQQAVLSPDDPERPRVVLATAIAQTSLTLDRVSRVVDAGFERRPVFDPLRATTRLETVRLSRHTAEQRAGRAGRTGPGFCIRLWPEGEVLDAASPAEIRQGDLAGLALTLAAWGCRDAGELDWLDPPSGPSWQAAQQGLRDLGAVDAEGALTATGKAMQQLPVAPRLAKLQVLGGQLGMPRTAAALAVILSERDPLTRRQDSDIEARLHWLLEGSGRQQKQWQRLIHRLAGHARDEPGTHMTIGELLARAWPDRVASRHGRHGRYRLANGQGVVLHQDDPMIRHDALVVADLQASTGGDGRCRLAAPVELAKLPQWLPDQISTEEKGFWDEDLGRARATRETRFGALLLSREDLARPSAELAAPLILEQVRRHGLEWLQWDTTSQQWRARVAVARGLFGDAWPDLSDGALLASLDDWLLPWLAGVTRREQLKDLTAVKLLSGLCPGAGAQLDEWLPPRFRSPDGRSWPIDYTASPQPVLALPVQALYGCRETPSVAGGRQPLTLHLLSPARRPLAVTSDLPSFWRQGYPQVRRDMRGRYPKHAWPEDPLAGDGGGK